MPGNLDRFKIDLERLIRQGELLDYSIVKSVNAEGFQKEIKTLLKDKGKIEKFLSAIPDFKTSYEAWYSEALALLRQLLPDRVDNFISFYEKPKNRKQAQYGNYVIQDYMQNLVVTGPLGDRLVEPSAAVHQFRQQLAIVKAARIRFESSLFEIRQLVQADLFDSELDAARELLKNKFLRAAGAIAGVVLEKHLKQVCRDHKVQIAKKNPSISDLNEALKKSSVIDMPQWRNISFLGDIRNLCDHDKSKDPTSDQVGDLIDGTEKVIKTVN